MGAKQQLLGLADDRLPPTMTFGPEDGMQEPVAELKMRQGGCCLSPCTHTHSLGARVPISPLPSQRQTSPKG